MLHDFFIRDILIDCCLRFTEIQPTDFLRSALIYTVYTCVNICCDVTRGSRIATPSHVVFHSIFCVFVTQKLSNAMSSLYIQSKRVNICCVK
ncbi:hypothetical protein [Cnaphalocrocis medinalis granulovirus]|uniref:Uncharacterized protein n=1 Tax=Cnaphalocrocis medinalis granulovirus TaxID=1750712 RepID=A0ACD4X2J8_9BBAC|nr:hypothetical protein [Cnaphalocrocis medinalis granulovirus]